MSAQPSSEHGIKLRHRGANIPQLWDYLLRALDLGHAAAMQLDYGREEDSVTDYDNLPPELAKALTRKAEAEARIAETKASIEEMQLTNITASNDANRVLNITGAIIDTDDAIATLQRWSRRDPGQPITIYLNTPGGSIFDGNALISCLQDLRRNGHHLTIKGQGMVMSFGAILLQIADDRILDKDTVFMMHSLSAPVIGGTLEGIGDTTKMLEAVQERMLDAMAAKATISKAKIKTMTRRKDLFLSAQDAHKYGFCDKVE